MADLKDVLGPRQVAKAVLSEVLEREELKLDTCEIDSCRDNTICPPCATAISRAARFGVDPK